MTNGPVLCTFGFCHGLATAVIEAFHRVVQRESAGVQVRVGLAYVRVAEQLLDVMERHVRLQPSRSGFVPEIMKMQIDRAELVARSRRKRRSDVCRFMIVSPQHRRQRDVTVTIRYVGHGPDMDIVEKLERILAECCGWKAVRDGTNQPALSRDPKFKVVFDSGITQSFDDLSFAFQEGDLLDGISIGRSMSDRHDYHHLVVKVLPS